MSRAYSARELARLAGFTVVSTDEGGLLERELRLKTGVVIPILDLGPDADDLEILRHLVHSGRVRIAGPIRVSPEKKRQKPHVAQA